MIKNTILRMHEHALRLIAHRWFLIGFSLSGAGFHGETFPVSNHKGARSLVTAHFNRIWQAERNAKVAGEPIPTTYRRVDLKEAA